MLLVDGHNLIGRTPGLSLADGSEARYALLEKLAAWGSSRAEPVVVVFDGGHPSPVFEDRFGPLRIVYARPGRTADDEILRRAGRGVTVVTSDRALAERARARGAFTVSCEEFLRRLRGRKPPPHGREKPEPKPEDVAYWLRVFGGR